MCGDRWWMCVIFGFPATLRALPQGFMVRREQHLRKLILSAVRRQYIGGTHRKGEKLNQMLAPVPVMNIWGMFSSLSRICFDNTYVKYWRIKNVFGDIREEDILSITIQPSLIQAAEVCGENVIFTTIHLERVSKSNQIDSKELSEKTLILKERYCFYQHFVVIFIYESIRNPVILRICG